MRSEFDRWITDLDTAEADLKKFIDTKGYPPELNPVHQAILRLKKEVRSAKDNINANTQVLAQSKLEVEYRTALLNAWPSPGWLDKIAYLATGLLGAGGAAFFVALNTLGQWVAFAPALALWVTGLYLLWYAVGGLRDYESVRFDYFADEFLIDEKYRPPLFGRGASPFETIKQAPQFLRAIWRRKFRR